MGDKVQLLDPTSGSPYRVGASTSLAGADGQSNTASVQTESGVISYRIVRQEVFNGTTFDRMRGDANGVTVQPALSANFWGYAPPVGGIVNTATAVTIKAAGGAAARNYVKSLQISHDTLGAATELAIRDGAGGTVLWRGRLQTTAQDAAPDTINFDPPLRGSANTLLEVVTLTAVTGGVYVNAQGYTGV